MLGWHKAFWFDNIKDLRSCFLWHGSKFVVLGVDHIVIKRVIWWYQNWTECHFKKPLKLCPNGALYKIFWLHKFQTFSFELWTFPFIFFSKLIGIFVPAEAFGLFLMHTMKGLWFFLFNFHQHCPNHNGWPLTSPNICVSCPPCSVAK